MRFLDGLKRVYERVFADPFDGKPTAEWSGCMVRDPVTTITGKTLSQTAVMRRKVGDQIYYREMTRAEQLEYNFDRNVGF